MKTYPSLSRILKWLFIVGVYVQIMGGCSATASAMADYDFRQVMGALGCLFPLAIIGGIMGGVVWAYNQDKEREQNTSDDFKDDNLLYRYGYSINQDTLSIPLKPEWSDQEIDTFSDEMRNRIAAKIKERFSSVNVEVINPVVIKDKDMQQDSRKFLKVSFRSKRDSQVSHFINYGLAGKYVVIHYLSRVRGKYRWHDVVDFVILGPITVWFWGMNWWQNQYSIISAMSKIVNNSYDLLDLKTFFSSSYLVLLDETRNFLKEKGLLTDEINQTIVNNINNSQNVNISGSQNVKLGGVVNAVQTAAQGLVKQS